MFTKTDTYRLYRLAVLILLAVSSSAPSFGDEHARSRLFLWQVTAASQQAFLLGSLHFGTEAMYPLADTVMDAYHDSTALVVELNILAADPIQMAQLMLSKGMYPTLENNLKAALTPSSWRALQAAAERFNIPIEIVQQQKPWLAALTLSVQAFKQRGFSERLGIDLHFLQLAQDQKPIIELETAAQQLGLFELLSAEEQEALLVQTLADLDNSDAYIETMLDSWVEGDAAALNQLLNDSLQANPGTARVYQLLLVDRNVQMTAKIARLLASGERPFVVVGAGHLVGPDSIVAMLREQGYQVTQQ